MVIFSDSQEYINKGQIKRDLSRHTLLANADVNIQEHINEQEQNIWNKRGIHQWVSNVSSKRKENK